MSAAHAPQTDWVLPSRGRVGMIALILAESTFFLTLVVAYLFYIGKSLSGPEPAQVLEFPIGGTVCLLSSSVTVMIAIRGLARDRMAVFNLWMLATVALGIGFLVLTAIEWQGLIVNHALWIDTSLFGSTFYTLVGFHAAHVTVGVLLLGLVLVLSLLGHVRSQYTERVELLSWYWHFVDAVWLVVLTSVYIIGV